MEVDYSALKKGGFMRQKQKNHFSMRLRMVAGHISAEQLKAVYEIANRFGKGYVHLTARQGIEIPFIRLEDIEEVKKALQAGGLEQGACGARVRTVTACQGNAVCPCGLIETQGLAQKLDARYFGKDLPHKFKLGITGCKNNCLKAEENDLGIKGGMLPAWNNEACTFCGLCQAVCPVDCITVDKDAKTLRFDEDACVYCGRCVKSCPTDAWQGKSGYVLSFGGNFGNNLQFGAQLLPILFEEEKLLAVVDATIQFFKEYGKPSERFSKTLNRVGLDKLRERLKEVIQ